ncbi:hypothetical protein [Glycomyces salinus]|uniref:hypothetical protein n=1 Tax=Glycomyces salinus TaxID=980294 RepID=UPI0018EAAAD4|nr:hypothetical protein [Glycomyces salinus]
MSGSPTARLRLVGLLFWLAGGTVLTFGWMGMAEIAYVDGQMPYLVSGAAAGLALVLVGSTLILYAAVLDSAERGARRTAELFKSALEDLEESDRIEWSEDGRDSSPDEADEQREMAAAGHEPK